MALPSPLLLLLLAALRTQAFTVPGAPRVAPSRAPAPAKLWAPRRYLVRSTPLRSTSPPELQAGETIAGEDAAAFSLEQQKPESWGLFAVLVTIVLGSLYAVWIAPDLGFAWSDKYIGAVEGACGGSPEATISTMLLIFAVEHSGLASLRPAAEEIVGARAWRVFFALSSLPLAYSSVFYYVIHRSDGLLLWNLHDVPGFHDFCWILSFVSFLLLYPSTFNLLEVAAVDKPQLHLWETGVTRITRHPQLWGQGLWCLAHLLWTGTSMALATSAMLVLHHSFGAWNGDRRLKAKHGDNFEAVKATTSIVPFAAILDGRQQLPADYWKEWARAPYLVVIAGTLGAYAFHPFFYGGTPTWFYNIQHLFD